MSRVLTVRSANTGARGLSACGLSTSGSLARERHLIADLEIADLEIADLEIADLEKNLDLPPLRHLTGLLDFEKLATTLTGYVQLDELAMRWW